MQNRMFGNLPKLEESIQEDNLRSILNVHERNSSHRILRDTKARYIYNFLMHVSKESEEQD